MDTIPECTKQEHAPIPPKRLKKLSDYVTDKLSFEDLAYRTDSICKTGPTIYFNTLSGPYFEKDSRGTFKKIGLTKKEFHNFVQFLNRKGSAIFRFAKSISVPIITKGLAKYSIDGIQYEPYKKPIITEKHQIFSFGGEQIVKEYRLTQAIGYSDRISINVVYIDENFYHAEEKLNGENISRELIGIKDHVATFAYAKNKKGWFKEDGGYTGEENLSDFVFDMWNYDIRECKLKLDKKDSN